MIKKDIEIGLTNKQTTNVSIFQSKWYIYNYEPSEEINNSNFLYQRRICKEKAISTIRKQIKGK